MHDFVLQLTCRLDIYVHQYFHHLPTITIINISITIINNLFHVDEKVLLYNTNYAKLRFYIYIHIYIIYVAGLLLLTNVHQYFHHLQTITIINISITIINNSFHVDEKVVLYNTNYAYIYIYIYIYITLLFMKLYTTI